MSGEEREAICAEEVGELVREYELLGSKEVRKEALEYMRFLREELGDGRAGESVECVRW